MSSSAEEQAELIAPCNCDGPSKLKDKSHFVDCYSTLRPDIAAAIQAAERGAAERERAMLKELEGIAALVELQSDMAAHAHEKRPGSLLGQYAKRLADWLAKHAAKEE